MSLSRRSDGHRKIERAGRTSTATMEIPPFPESGWEKTKRKFAEEPLVPIGCLVTAGVLVGGLRSFVTMADQKTQQRFMRARVVAQGATVVAVAVGSFIALAEKQKK